MLATAATITTTARLLSPIINDLYKGAKKAGARGLLKWEETTFARKLARRLRIIDEVKTIWSPDKEVSIAATYYPSKIIRDGKAIPITRLSDLGEGNIVIEGTVGQGKSVLLRHLAMEEVLSNDARRLPVFIELRTLGIKFNLQQAVLKQLSTYDIELDEDTLGYLQKSGRISYLLDGFDELDEAVEKETLIELEFLSQKYPELQIVTTSRLDNSIQKTAAFSIVRIAPLTSSDYVPFISKLNISTVQATLIKEAIRKSPSQLASLITTPLMLTMVVIVYQSEYEIPETLPDFFERLFHVVFTRHDKLKATYERKRYCGLSERRLQTLFEAFCFMAMQNNFTRSLKADQFVTAFDEAIEYSENCKCEVEKFKLDITKVACLMLDEGLDTTTFLHKSIMEYYAAAFIKHSADEVASMFYAEVVSDSRTWWEVLSFLKEIDPYRFSKNFVLPEAKFVNEKVLTISKENGDKTLGPYFERMHPGLCVNFACKEGGIDFRVHSYGPFQHEAQMGIRELTNELLRAFDKTIPAGLTKSALLEITGGLSNRVEGELTIYEISIPLMVRHWGGAHFWEALSEIAKKIDRQVENAEKIMQEQDRRKLIFLKKKTHIVPG